MPRKLPAATEPSIAELGPAYTLKSDLKKKGIAYKVGALRGRWPKLDPDDRDSWVAYWAIPLPAGTTDVVQKVPGVEVKVEQWDYGTVAQILHLGPYSEEAPTIGRLHRFITESGHEIAGPHEEEYLSSPQAKVPKTIIRYQVRKK